LGLTQTSQGSAETTTLAMVSPTPAPSARPALPKHVIGLRLNEGGWTTPDNNGLWQGVGNVLRETPSGSFEIVLYDEDSPLASDMDLVLTTLPALNQQVETTLRQHPRTHFVVFDTVNTLPMTFPTLHQVTFEEHEVSYLLGYMAGTLSQTGQVGFVISEAPKALANGAAFAQGLLAACNECQLHQSVLDAESSMAFVTSTSQALVSQGVDIIYTDAGGLSQGVVDYVTKTMCASATQTRPSPLTSALTLVAKNINYLSRCAGAYPLFFMGTGVYQPALGDNDNDPSSLNHGLTSVAKRIDLATYKVVQAFLVNDLPAVYPLTLKDKAVDVAVDDYNRSLLPSEVLDRLETIKSDIISGEIVVDTLLKN
jgi:basic membrane protein A and related proteins